MFVFLRSVSSLDCALYDFLFLLTRYLCLSQEFRFDKELNFLYIKNDNQNALKPMKLI